MKTRDRILLTARDLFNTLGEHNVAASDIAAEMEISPGNLYYHFKGKDSIHLSLFATLQREMISILGPAIQTPGLFGEQEQGSSVERSWLFLSVVLELMLGYRYFYEDPGSLMLRFPEIDRGFRRLVRLKLSACEVVAAELVAGEASTDRQGADFSSLANTMSLTLNYWLPYSRILYPAEDRTLTIHRGVLQILSTCAPYMEAEQHGFIEECQQLYSAMLASGEYGGV